jgi:hypothetical protein
MKRILGTALLLLIIGFIVPVEAKTAEISHENTTLASSAPQRQSYRYGQHYNRRRARKVTSTRLVRYGRRLYRETYVTRYLPNGRTATRIISRARVG